MWSNNDDEDEEIVDLFAKDFHSTKDKEIL